MVLAEYIVMATHNQGKIKELKLLLADTNLKLLSLADFPELGPLEETGQTFRENARQKAETVAKATVGCHS